MMRPRIDDERLKRTRSHALALRLGDDMPATGEVDVGGARYLYLRTGTDPEKRQLGTLVPLSGAKSARCRYFPLPGARRAWQDDLRSRTFTQPEEFLEAVHDAIDEALP